MARTFKAVAVASARAASDKKGERVVLLDVTLVSPVTDYMLLVTAMAPAHLSLLENEVREAAKDFGLTCLHRARPESSKWRVLDFGGVLVHLMTAEARDFYSLEKLYHEAPRVKWELAVRKKAHA